MKFRGLYALSRHEVTRREDYESREQVPLKVNTPVQRLFAVRVRFELESVIAILVFIMMCQLMFKALNMNEILFSTRLREFIVQ